MRFTVYFFTQWLSPIYVEAIRVTPDQDFSCFWVSKEKNFGAIVYKMISLQSSHMSVDSTNFCYNVKQTPLCHANVERVPFCAFSVYINFETWGSLVECRKEPTPTHFLSFLKFLHFFGLNRLFRLIFHQTWELFVGKVEGRVFFFFMENWVFVSADNFDLKLHCQQHQTQTLKSSTLIETIGLHLFSLICKNLFQHACFWSKWSNDFCLLLLTCKRSNEVLKLNKSDWSPFVFPTFDFSSHW